jgi:hypothetical protein
MEIFGAQLRAVKSEPANHAETITQGLLVDSLSAGLVDGALARNALCTSRSRKRADRPRSVFSHSLAIEACRVTHTNVCQTEQMPFLHRNRLVVVLDNRGSILRTTLYVVAAVSRGRSGGNYGIETENRLTFAVFRRSGLSPIGFGEIIADFDVWEAGNLDAATTSVAY